MQPSAGYGRLACLGQHSVMGGDTALSRGQQILANPARKCRAKPNSRGVSYHMALSFWIRLVSAEPWFRGWPSPPWDRRTDAVGCRVAQAWDLRERRLSLGVIQLIPSMWKVQLGWEWLQREIWMKTTLRCRKMHSRWLSTEGI